MSSNTSTFAPSFIKEEEDLRQNQDAVKSIEGENDFSGKRYVWLKDPEEAFVKGWVIAELEDNKILVQTDNGTVSCFFIVAQNGWANADTNIAAGS
jgi:myosin protein heavy chain